MVPASWGVYPAPTADLCTKYFGTPVSDALNGKGELVYAVAGLDYHDQPISNSRAQSLPTRATAGFMGTGRTRSGHTDNWTGTSVAAATLSAIAARLWTQAPQLSPHELMAVIDASGTPLDLIPDLRGFGSSSTRVKKIQAHDALARICSNPTGCNPYRAPVAGQAWSGVSAAFQRQPTLFASAITSPNALRCVSTQVKCGSQTVDRTICDKPSAPRRPRNASVPWTRPQPDVPVCPVCPVQGNELTLTLDPTYGGSFTLRDPVLAYRRPTGEQVEAVLTDQTVGASPVVVDLNGYTIRIDGVVKPLGRALEDDGITTAELRFVVPDAAGRPSLMTSTLTVHE